MILCYMQKHINKYIYDFMENTMCISIANTILCTCMYTNTRTHGHVHTHTHGHAHVRTCTHTHVIVSSKRKPYNVSTPLDPQEYRTVLNIFNPGFKSSSLLSGIWYYYMYVLISIYQGMLLKHCVTNAVDQHKFFE